MTERFAPRVDATLRAAGWYPGRQLPPDAVAALHGTIAQESGRFGGRLAGTDFADRVLAEFGGLVIGGERPGVDLNPRPFALDPTMAVHNVETLIDAGRSLGVGAFPIGVEGLDEAVLAVTDLGSVLAIDPTGEWLLGSTIDDALDLLITGRRPRPAMPRDGRASLESLKRPAGAAFFLPRAPANLPYVWLPDTLIRIGIPPTASPSSPGRFDVADWGGLPCEIHALDLTSHTVLVIAFELDAFHDLRVEQPGSEAPPPPPDATPLAHAFRSACTALAPELRAAFTQTRQTDDLLGRFADQEPGVADLDGGTLLDQGFSLVYLPEQYGDGSGRLIGPQHRDQLPVVGGQIIFRQSGQERW